MFYLIYFLFGILICYVFLDDRIKELESENNNLENMVDHYESKNHYTYRREDVE